MNVISSQKSIKTQKNFYFFILFHFQHTHIVPKPYWYVLKMAFHIAFQVCFIVPEVETLEQAHSGVTRTQILKNLQRPPNFHTFLLFRYFKWNIFLQAWQGMASNRMRVPQHAPKIILGALLLLLCFELGTLEMIL